MNYKALIVEDEPLLSRALRKQIEHLRPDIMIDDELRTVEDTVKWLKNNPEPAIIFMDIQLADGICFSIFNQADVSNKAIIFTTAYNEYAIEAFDINSVAYLLKPIKIDELRKVFIKLEKISQVMESRLTSAQKIDYSKLAEEVTRQQNKFRKRFLVAKADAYKQIPVEDIAFFMVEDKITIAVTFKNRQHIIDWTLSDLEEELNPDDFLRMNRQFIINLNAIERVENYFNSKLIIKLITGLETPERIVVSREKATMVKNWLDR
ncbi:LytTR family DNA-binding domain-containing protein [Marinilabilia salmonicolor]|uniref:LytTR family two component transcriptional regulator n=1 Tax=Marinilabilia salmonicolor TaxID=989 RepID=A0A368VCN0_9BACT|nr:LytTR family DNA-binding domain-containing protein [Marinilabilia salmonicolor]RCW38872.1 LytTR family two component transcriptional regulator [Marinilabilia salmonicolor]